MHAVARFFLNFALFPLTSLCLAWICSEQYLEICISSTSCVCLPLYNVSLIVFLNCKSLWIKASAKWINVNVMKIPMAHRSVADWDGNKWCRWESSSWLVQWLRCQCTNQLLRRISWPNYIPNHMSYHITESLSFKCTCRHRYRHQ